MPIYHPNLQISEVAYIQLSHAADDLVVDYVYHKQINNLLSFKEMSTEC